MASTTTLILDTFFQTLAQSLGTIIPHDPLHRDVHGARPIFGSSYARFVACDKHSGIDPDAFGNTSTAYPRRCA